MAYHCGEKRTIRSGPLRDARQMKQLRHLLITLISSKTRWRLEKKMQTITVREHVFEIVDKIPFGFFVWNIGENMGHDEYIPICQDLRPGDKDNYEINPNTLKAIKLSVEEVQLLRKAAGYGVVSKETAEKALKSKKKGYISDRRRSEAQKTIEIFKRITA